MMASFIITCATTVFIVGVYIKYPSDPDMQLLAFAQILIFIFQALTTFLL